MNLTKEGKKLFLWVTVGSVLITGLLAWLWWPASIITGLLYVAFIVFNIVLNNYCINLIDRNNAETEKHAELNNSKVKYISPQMYDRLMNKDGADLGDNIIVNKEEVTLI